MTSSNPNQIFWNLANVEDDTTLTFQILNTDVAYVNTLRRMILTGVESLAFNSKMTDTGTTTDVKISANTTPMTNEMLADRIGLIPISINTETWNPSGWDKDQYEFRLSMENNTSSSMPVKVQDIEVFKLGTAEEGYVKYPPGNHEFFKPDPVSGDTCLIALLKAKQPNQAAQKIEFRARASVGTGNQHIRWCPVSQCSYSYSIDPDEGRQQQFFQRWLENNKKMSLDSLNDEPGKKEAMIREFQTMEVQRCYKVNEKSEPNSFDFVVESIGTMPIFDIVERALYNIERKCTKYSGELPPDVRVVPADARMKGFDFYFPNEDHTLGNLLQAYMDANMMDTNEISYVGYKVPHPLRAEMVLRVGVDFERDKARDGKQTVARAAISRAAAQCAILFREWREDWTRAKTRPIGMRNRESLRLNVANARALEQAAALVAPRAAPVQAPPGARRQPQKSAFYGKLLDRASGQEAPGGTPPYSPGGPGRTPNYSPASPLPPGWDERVNNDGQRYWSAFQGRVTTTERPTAPPTPPFVPGSTTPAYVPPNNNNNITSLPPPPPF
jgi:DNA-directed RNA polymerase subunit L